VLLVDADLRRPRVHECLRISGTPGLAQVLSGALPATDAMVRFEELPALHVLPSGGPAEDPTELLDSAAARELFALLRQRFELVLVDSPPIGPLADYEELSMLCDATLLVARPDTTSRALLYESIQKVGRRLMGVVLNGVEDWFLWTQYKPEYYRHYHREPRHGPGDRG
jgi:polysaccharide biosynthesis transport protein